MDKKYNITKLRETTEWNERVAAWFHDKWEVPQEAYLDSIEESQNSGAGVPQWYLLTIENEIVAGLGVIENDFHNRKDLSPNICALYVEEAFRKQGIARMMLEFVCKDLADRGYQELYLITDHTEFYEKCGWEFLCLVAEEDGNMTRMYHCNFGGGDMIS